MIPFNKLAYFSLLAFPFTNIFKMKYRKLLFSTLSLLFTFLLFSQDKKQPTPNISMSLFAQSKNQWTGIAISKKNRVFVNFPRWSKETPISVAEIINGKPIAYPNISWNNWDIKTIEKRKFICVQSIYVDDTDFLWVLDTGYELQTDSTKGAYLYCFNLRNNTLYKEYFFSVEKISGKAYLNDLRIDTKKHVAYFTDSQVGGLVLLDLKTNEIRRVLAKHPSTLNEVHKIEIEGYERTHPVHSDGIELDIKNEYLYYCSLMGENVYRIPTQALLDKNLTDELLGQQVEKFAKTGANDGIIFDKNGNLYLSSLEKNAISKVNSKGIVEKIISDKEIKWPDSFAFDRKGNLFFTISQIHLPKEKRGIYKIFKLTFN